MITTRRSSFGRSYRPWARGRVVALALLGTISLSACGGGEDDRDLPTDASAASTRTPAPAPNTSSADAGASSSDGTRIRIIFGDNVHTARLRDNAPARDLAAQLPLTLTFRDLNDVEKIAPLPRELSLNGVPAGDDPVVGDIGYFAPEGDLVFYYGDVGFWNGIVRIGEFDGDMGAIARQSDDFSVTIEAAD